MPIVAEDIAAKNVIIQNECSYQARGIFTFIEKMLTTRVGSIMAIVIRVSAFMRILRLLLMIEARASMRLDKTCE